ncbi:hypothetical protein M8J77_020159 [Diaphorina citri]|nr:hypothetical protein M8J77_020159 [Diaphorina citri]
MKNNKPTGPDNIPIEAEVTKKIPTREKITVVRTCDEKRWRICWEKSETDTSGRTKNERQAEEKVGTLCEQGPGGEAFIRGRCKLTEADGSCYLKTSTPLEWEKAKKKKKKKKIRIDTFLLLSITHCL